MAIYSLLKKKEVNNFCDTLSYHEFFFKFSGVYIFFQSIFKRTTLNIFLMRARIFENCVYAAFNKYLILQWKWNKIAFLKWNSRSVHKMIVLYKFHPSLMVFRKKNGIFKTLFVIFFSLYSCCKWIRDVHLMNFELDISF